MIKYLRRYIQYNEIFSDSYLSIEEIKKEFSHFEKASLLEILCKINLALWKHRLERSLQFRLSQFLFSEDDYRLVEKALLRNKGLIFHRQQILFCIKLLLSVVTIEEGKLEHANMYKNKLGKILLSLNDYTEPLGSNVAQLIKNKLDTSRQGFARAWYFTHTGDIRNRMARCLTLWIKIPRSKRGRELLQNISFNPKKEFLAETGLSMFEFIGTTLALLAKYLSIEPKTAKAEDFLLHKLTYFSTTKLEEMKRIGIFNQLLLDKARFNEIYNNDVKSILNGEDIREYNFLSFEDKPLIELDKDKIIPIDPYYLANKVTDGIYWILLNRFKRLGEFKKKRGRELSKYYGHLIQEYVFQILRNICDEVIELPPDDKKTADFICKIIHNDRIFLVVSDSKKIALQHRTKILSDRENTLKDLDRIFGVKSGFAQIYETIRRIRQNKVKGINVNLGEIDGIFPILITDREICEDPLSRLLYEMKYFNDHKKRLFHMPKPKIFEPIFICLDELEVIESYCISQGKEQFLKLILERNRILKIRKTESYVYKIPVQLVPLWNYLYELGFMQYENQRLIETFKYYHEKMADKLFVSNVFHED